MLRFAQDYGAQARTASGVNVVLGIWLIASPWVFDYSGKSAVLNSVTVGALIAFLASIRVASLHSSVGLSGINLLLAFWVVLSSWAYENSANKDALLNDIFVGIGLRACHLERDRHRCGAETQTRCIRALISCRTA